LRTRAFDEMANDYDESFTDTGVGRALRNLVWRRLEQNFRPNQRILELGCGTGEDATHLARAGVRVVATDPSSRMIQTARNKARSYDCEGFIDFHCLEMEQLGPSLDGQKFDGVLSNFGAVNCARKLPELVADIAGRLRPGAALVWVPMGRSVPWEWLWYSLRGEWSKAWRRFRTNGVQWRDMTITYPTPSQLCALLRPYFRVERVSALGCVLPPSYAAAWLERSPRTLATLTWLEKQAQSLSALASCSDHFIVEATRL
jgi:ubiquinone/menaquinone biosynthesis C-methylase UbiE